VDVDADVNADADADVTELCSRSELGKHGDDSFKELPRRLKFRGRNRSHRLEGVEDGGALEGRATRDRVEPRRIAPLLSAALRDVEANRDRGAAQLIAERRMAARGTVGQGSDKSDELDRTTIDVEALKAEHDIASTPAGSMLLGEGRFRELGFGHVSVSVSVHVYDHDHVHVHVHVAGADDATAQLPAKFDRDAGSDGS
jgi:hypothetical protein